MHSPYVGTLLSTPQSRISVNPRKISYQSLGGGAFNIGTPQSVASAVSTTNTIEFYRLMTSKMWTLRNMEISSSERRISIIYFLQKLHTECPRVQRH